LDIKLIKQVVDLMNRSELSEFEFEEEGFKLRLSRNNGQGQAPAQMMQPAPMPLTAMAAASESPSEPAEEAGIAVIKSPMVGTFYRAPSPDSPVFTDVGKRVNVDSIVCIIEAMKVMNEIHAEISGTITEVLVENGDSVEYGQPLFKVKTA